jgi:hypothetical protein
MMEDHSKQTTFPTLARVALYFGMILVPLLAHLEVAINANRVTPSIAIPAYNILLFASLLVSIIAPFFIRRGIVIRVATSILALFCWIVLHIGMAVIMLRAAN